MVIMAVWWMVSVLPETVTMKRSFTSENHKADMDSFVYLVIVLSNMYI